MSSPVSKATPRALTIAGFDPSAGAGVLADARTFAAFGLEPAAAVTSITFQNSHEVMGAFHLDAETVHRQVTSLLKGGGISCAKTGMLPTSDVVSKVAKLFRERDLPKPVVDPVMVSSSGYKLIEESAIDALMRELFPLARVVTPNIPEAERITGLSITSESDMRAAAARIRAMGAQAVLLKGGHLSGASDAVDILDDDGVVTAFRDPRVPDVQVHGTGCVLSSAIAAGLGQGKTLVASVRAAKNFVLQSLRSNH
jgi:hydroxymethylpyrimidine/phosphomethylpyrimidine kinase